MITQMKQKDIAPLRESLLREQGGVCPICNKPCLNPVLDHEHKKRIGGTGQIRGVICSLCNVFLAKCENNSKRYCISPKELPRVLRRITSYLNKEQQPFIHPSEKEKEPILQKVSYNVLKARYKGRAKFPEYRLGKGDKPAQKMTIKLKALFKQYGIEPKFYSR